MGRLVLEVLLKVDQMGKLLLRYMVKLWESHLV